MEHGDNTVKQFAFQYATSCGHFYEDTGLINKDDAMELWRKYTPTFKAHMLEDDEPEMVIWCGMRDKHDYRFKLKHWVGANMKLIDGGLWEEVA